MRHPNIILIMADDMGYGDVGCYNADSRIPTPNMDRLAGEGLLFTDAHAPSAVCTPTRYGVLTGRYCWRTRLKLGVTGSYDPPLIEPSRLTIASMLKQRGYTTACIGKWHVGLGFQDTNGQPTEEETDIDFSRPVTGGPRDLGFDYAWFNAACGTCAPPYGFIENEHFVDKSFSFFDPGKHGPVGVGAFGQWGGMMGAGWDTKEADVIIADKARRYIERQASVDQPFFLYLTPNAPHEPCLERFVPEFARGQSDAGSRGDLVWLFDWIVGQVVETLATTGQADDTLVIITSDNGPLPGDFVLDENGQRLYSDPRSKEFRYHTYDHASNGEWRGYKAHIWEGGHRIPLLARWPESIAPGMRSDTLICLTDLMATCAGITGYSLPDGAAEDSYDMTSAFLPDEKMKQRSAGPCRETVIHHSSFGVFSIRRGRWKLVADCPDSGGWPTPRGTPPKPGAPGQLYDILADPGEDQNLWEERPDVVRRLIERLETIKATERTAPERNL